MSDELNIKGVDYQMVLEVSTALAEYYKAYYYTIKCLKEEHGLTEDDEQVQELYGKVTRGLRFNQTLIDWLKQNEIESN